MNTRKAMSEAIAVLDAPGSQGVGRTMYLKTRWTKVEEPSRSPPELASLYKPDSVGSWRHASCGTVRLGEGG